VFRIVGQCDFYFRSPFHDVIVRQNETGFIDDETCSCTLATTSIFRHAKIKEVGREPGNLGDLASAALPASALPSGLGYCYFDLYYGGIQLSGNLGKGIGQGYRVRDGYRGGFLFEGRFHSTRHDGPNDDPDAQGQGNHAEEKQSLVVHLSKLLKTLNGNGWVLIISRTQKVLDALPHDLFRVSEIESGTDFRSANSGT
jgi:hypothetical protein